MFRVPRRDSLEPGAAKWNPVVLAVAAATGRPADQRLRLQLHERARVRERDREEAEGTGGRPVRLSGELEPGERPSARESNGHVSGEEEFSVDLRVVREAESDRAERVAHVRSRLLPRPQLPAANRIHGADDRAESTRQTVPRVAGRRVLLGLRGRAVRDGQAILTVETVPALRQVWNSSVRTLRTYELTNLQLV
ncbi:hypothetical protein K0M31_003156 [Melipona bicolor]|uniref:Uncharacterized protein n=1 Tax=Melipona bicolor TaxID=60889 RepID=A0AA40KP72_9HYME|nr:hypothetical protein K0M31_003156 [Melipona bicolor]